MRRPLAGLALMAALGATADLRAQAQPPAPMVSSEPDRFVRKWFETRPWYEPLVAEPRGAQVSLIALARSREFPFMVKEGSRRVWEIHLGREVPFVLREKGSSGDGPMAPGGWGFGVWFPVSVHFVEDFKDEGHPIVNTDYRVGAMFKVAHGLTRFPRDRVFFQLQIGHESGHVGDEFLLNAQSRSGPAFERVDVTYQFFEGGVSWDHTLGAAGRGQLTVRASAAQTFTYKGRNGFYVPQLADGTPLSPSVRHLEPAIGVQYVPLGTRGAGLVLSLDLRQKTIYNFHKVVPGQREDAQWSSSFAVAVRPLSLRARGTPEFVFKAYRGVNPNGLFRTQRDYWLFGLGLHLRV
jgi:hypothetical protein